MSESTTIARPYAKAIFEYALGDDKLAEWSACLKELAQTVLIPEVEQFITNPATTIVQHVELLETTVGIKPNENNAIKNLIALLATNKRLLLLPEISTLYETHRAEQEKTLSVDVISYTELSKAQQQRLIESLSQRLQRKVSLKIRVDPSLLGGAIIQAGDLVIDGSVRGKLNKLCVGLAA